MAKKTAEIEFKVGLFVTTGLLLAMGALFALGGQSNFFSKKVRFSSHFTSVEGLAVGARVVLGGVAVGTIDAIHLDEENRNILVRFSIGKDGATWVRADSSVEIATQGVLGDKYLVLHGGSINEPPISPGADIPYVASKDLSHLFTKSDQVLVNVDEVIRLMEKILKAMVNENRHETLFKGLANTSKNLASLTERLNRDLSDLPVKRALVSISQIVEKVNNGSGTLGALVNDAGLYDEIRALVGGANRSRIIRNLVRKTIKDTNEAESSPTK